MVFFGTVIHDEEQRAQADADGTQVGAFVDLEQCMDLVAVGRMSWTWSATMASRPQPKELSSTSSRFGCCVMYWAAR